VTWLLGEGTFGKGKIEERLSQIVAVRSFVSKAPKKEREKRAEGERKR